MGKLLIYSLLSYGHQNVGAVLGNHILDTFGDQHQVYIAVDQDWKDQLQPKNPRFIYKLYTNLTVGLPGKSSSDSKDNPIVKMAQQLGEVSKLPPIEQNKIVLPHFLKALETLPLMEDDVSKIIDEVQPDLIITDQMNPMPFIIKRNIPWVNLIASNPLIFGHDQLPPTMSGLRTDEPHKWDEYRKVLYKSTESFRKVIDDWLVKNDCRPLRANEHHYESPFFNIYCYPKAIDYFEDEKVKLPGKWLRLSSPIAPSKEIAEFELPDKLKALPGKWIYFSMGTLYSAYTPLLQRLLNLFGQLPHKFIVSKGPAGDQLNLPDNCWGENFLNQNAILKKVNLFISHGGNNSLCESFHFGVPMIVLPMFTDQHDNATRLEETNFGRRLNAHFCSKNELQEAIDDLLGDAQLADKLKSTAMETQQDNGIQAITNEIILYLDKNTKSLSTTSSTFS